MSAFGDKVLWAWFSDAVAVAGGLLQRRHVFVCWKKILGTHCCSIRAYCGARVGLAVIQRICHRDQQAFTWHCNSASARGSWVVSATPCWLKHAVGCNLKVFWLEAAMKRVPKKNVVTAAGVDEPTSAPRPLKRKSSTTLLGNHEAPTLIPNLFHND